MSCRSTFPITAVQFAWVVDCCTIFNFTLICNLIIESLSFFSSADVEWILKRKEKRITHVLTCYGEGKPTHTLVLVGWLQPCQQRTSVRVVLPHAYGLNLLYIVKCLVCAGGIVKTCWPVVSYFQPVVSTIYRIHPSLMKENRKMSTCNWLDLQILARISTGYVMPKNLPNHCLNLWSD